MTNEKDPQSPATTSSAWDCMEPRWKRIETLLGGTDAMRAAGQLYLPMHEEETDGNYQDRLESNVLFNLTELTLDSWVGKPFERPVQVVNAPERIMALLDDVDLQGNDITVFARQWFRESLAKAFAHVLVDFPEMSEDERANRTLADDLQDGRRPYWCLIRPENLIFAVSEIVKGEEVITHARIKQYVTVRDGYAEKTVEQIKVLEPGLWEVYEERKTKSGKSEWVAVDGGSSNLFFVPLRTFYADRQGLMLGKPPLEDIACLNIRHWQSSGDQNNILTVARFPMLASAGVTTTGDDMAIGPKQLLSAADPQSRFYYVEHSGQAIAAGRQDLLDLEEQMASYGAQFLKRRPNGQTATARALDSAEAISPLQEKAVRFQDALTHVLWMTAQWLHLGIEEKVGGQAKVYTDFKANEAMEMDVRALNEARRNGDLSHKAYIEEYRRRNILSSDFSQEANDAELEEERKKNPEKFSRNNGDNASMS